MRKSPLSWEITESAVKVPENALDVELKLDVKRCAAIVRALHVSRELHADQSYNENMIREAGA